MVDEGIVSADMHDFYLVPSIAPPRASARPTRTFAFGELSWKFVGCVYKIMLCVYLCIGRLYRCARRVGIIVGRRRVAHQCILHGISKLA